MQLAMPGRLHRFSIVVLAGLWAFSAAAQAQQAATPVQLKGEVLLAPDSDALAWRWRMKLASLGPAGNGTRDEFSDPAAVQRRIREMAHDGYNAVICNGLHFHLCFLDRWEMWKANMARIVEAAHAQGMKVIEHYDVPVVFSYAGGFKYLAEHADWLQRDIRFDTPNLHAMCLNHPGFRQEYLDRLKDFARSTKIDGVMLDECCFADDQLCGCRWCRARFTADTGCTLPTDDSSPVLFNADHPLWVTWLKWRVKTLGDWWVDVRRTLNRVGPDISILTYTTHGGFTTNTSMREGGNDIFEKARACDFLGTEIMSRNVFDCYRPVLACRKMKSALGRHFSSPIFGLVYHMDDPDFAYFGWALCQMNGQATWMSTIEGADMKRYIDWPQQMDSRHSQSVADIAVLFSNATRQFNRLMNQAPDAMGFSECLTDAHLQHDFLTDGDLTEKTLRRYKLLILPSCGCLSAEQVRNLQRYVAGGGRLLVSGHTSLYNEDGFGGENFQLASLLGVDYAGQLTKGASVIHTSDGQQLDHPDKAIMVRARSGAKVLAELRDAKGRPLGAAVVRNNVGQGVSHYLAPRLAALNFEREFTVKDKWTFEANQPAAKLLIDLVGSALGTGPVLRAVQVPSKVLLSTYRQQRDGKSQWLVHLLNATGVRLKLGQTVAAKKSQPAFPPLEQDLVFELRLDGPCQAEIVSPDYAEARPVVVAEVGGGYQRVTVARSDLTGYAIVRLAQPQ